MRIPFPLQVVPPESSEQRPPTVWPQRISHLRMALSSKWLKFSLRLGCTILLFTFLLRSVSWPAVLDRLRNLDQGELMIGMIVGVFGIIISSYQWQSLLDAEHIRMDLRRLVNLYLVGIAFNHFLPSGMGGDVAKAYYVGKEGKNTPGAASAVVMSRVTGFFGMLLVSVPTVLVWHTIFSQGITLSFLLSCLAMCAALGGALFLVTILPRLTHGRLAHLHVLNSVTRVGITVRKSIARPRAMSTAIIFGLLFHISAALNYYGYAVALHIHVPLTFFLVAIPFVSLIAFLPISINGFGLRESAFVFIFSTVHVPVATALLLALLVDIQGLFFGLIGGCIYFTQGERSTQARRNMQTQKLPV